MALLSDNPISDSTEQHLRDQDNIFAIHVLPTILLLAILMVVGVLGNALVCCVYLTRMKRNTTMYFIVTLAVFDLLTCIISIPAEILDIRYNYTFGTSPLCTILRGLLNYVSISSGCILLIIAIDRYRRICKVFEKQMTERIAKCSICWSSVLALVVAVPAWFMYGPGTVQTPEGVNGTTCTIPDDLADTHFPLVFYGIQFLFFLTTAIALGTLYTLIGRQVYTQQRYRTRVQFQSTASIPDQDIVAPNLRCCESSATALSECSGSTTQDSMSPQETHQYTSLSPSSTNNDSVRILSMVSMTDGSREDCAEIPPRSWPITFSLTPVLTGEDDEDLTQSTEIKLDVQAQTIKLDVRDPLRFGNRSLQRRGSSSVASLTRRKSSLCQRQANESVKKLTLVMFLITLVFIVSYLPYLCVMVAWTIYGENLIDGMTDFQQNAYEIALRSHFLNCASNPIIYNICNGKFLKELRNLLRNIFKQWQSLKTIMP